jgi:TRAP-type C4-dicarboxylate transport system substrate-binding protein
MHPALRVLASFVAAAALAAPAAAQQTIRLTFASGYPPTFSWIQEVQRTLAPEVNRELAAGGGRYRVEWNFALAGTLAKIPAMLEAMENGQADVGHVAHFFAPGKLPLQSVGMYAPFGSTDLRLVSALTDEMEAKLPVLAKQWASYNLVLLASFPLDSYVLVSRVPIRSLADLRGRKVGGAGPNLNWLEGTGAVGVQTTGAQAYNDLKNGVFDALFTPASFVVSAKYYEVAPHMVKIDVGAVNGGQIVANAGAWQKMPPEVQAAMRKAAGKFVEATIATVQAQAAEADAVTLKAGGTVSPFPRAERAKWANALPNVAQRWAKELDAKGLPGTETLGFYMDGMRARNVDLPRQWDRN